MKTWIDCEQESRNKKKKIFRVPASRFHNKITAQKYAHIFKSMALTYRMIIVYSVATPGKLSLGQAF